MTALAPASLSISAERSPVNAPLGSAWQSCAPISTEVPFAAAAKRTSSVAGGHIIRSTAVSFCAPSTIRVNSAAEDRRPFIFQLPATSGRRGARTIVVSRVFPNPAKRLAERSRARQRSVGGSLLSPPYVAMLSPPPYDATTPVRRGFSQSRMTHASRSTKSLFQLARQGGDGRRCRLLGDQFRDLGDRRYFPRLRPFDRRQDRAYRNYNRAVPDSVQRSAAAIFTTVRPPDHPRSGAGDRLGPGGDHADIFGDPARRARARAGSRALRRRGRQTDYQRSGVSRAERPVRPFSFRANHP